MGSEEEMQNEFLSPFINTLEYFKNQNPKCVGLVFIVSETSEQPSKRIHA